MKRYVLIILASLMFFSLAACGGDKNEEGKIIVSGKKFTEQIILAHIMGEYLKANTDLDVKMEEGLGGVFTLHEAMKKGEIDMYVEYTGTAFEVIDKIYEPSMSQEDVFNITSEEYQEQFNFKWLEPLGFNNTYILATRLELYDDLDLETFSDLSEHTSDLSFAGSSEFFEREDGFDGLMDEYEYDKFNDQIIIDPDLMYLAAQNGDTDVISAFATDARLDEYELKTLEDDKSFFPPYDAAVVIRQEILDANPGLEEDLSKLSGLFTDEKMRALNGKVNIDGKDDKDVAIEFLKEEGFID